MICPWVQEHEEPTTQQASMDTSKANGDDVVIFSNMRQNIRSPDFASTPGRDNLGLPGVGAGAGLGNNLLVNDHVAPSRPVSDFHEEPRILDLDERSSMKSIQTHKSGGLTHQSKHSDRSQINLSERSLKTKLSDIKTSSSESEPAAACDWKGFHWKKGPSKLQLNKNRVRHYQENYQMDLGDSDNFRDKYWNFKSQLCEDLQEISQYHKVFKIQDDKIVTWRTKQMDDLSPLCNFLPKLNPPKVKQTVSDAQILEMLAKPSFLI
jgi:hypothetical protein